MNHRLTTLKSLETYSSDKTEIIDISVKDPMTALIFDLEVHNSAAGSMSYHPINCLKTVELVDGSDVLFSLSGPELEALDWYNNKTFRSNYNYALADGYCCRFVGYQFGRYLYDPKYALDPTKFRNLQLKVTLDIDGGGLAPTYNKLQVWAMLFDGKAITPEGFLMSKEIRNYTLTASGHEYIDLPVDHPYRKLLIRQQTPGTEPNQLLANIKLSEDQDKKVPFNHGTEDILRSIMATHPQVIESYFFALDTSNRYLMIAPTTRVTAFGSVWAAAAVAQDEAFYDGDGGRLKTIAAANPSNTQILVTGWLPHGVWAIPFGNQDDPDDWYDVTPLGNLKADITAASGAASTDSCQIFVEQVRKYAAA